MPHGWTGWCSSFLVNTLVTPDVLDLQTELLAEDAARDPQRQQQALEESQAAIACLADRDLMRASTPGPPRRTSTPTCLKAPGSSSTASSTTC